MAWWTLTITGNDNPTDIDLEHIAEAIKEGNTCGELNDEEESSDE